MKYFSYSLCLKVMSSYWRSFNCSQIGLSLWLLIKTLLRWRKHPWTVGWSRRSAILSIGVHLNFFKLSMYRCAPMLLVTDIFLKNDMKKMSTSNGCMYCFLAIILTRRSGVDVTAGPWPVYLRSGQSNWTKIGPLGQLMFSGHLGQQLSLLPCHSISTDNRLMKFTDKTLKFNFNHSPKAINSLITQSACVYLDLLPHLNEYWQKYMLGTSTS
jgi:hypothetical protein